MKLYILLKTIVHNILISIFGFSSTCHQHPSCSQYTAVQIKEHGTMLGLWRGALRAMRCYSLFHMNLSILTNSILTILLEIYKLTNNLGWAIVVFTILVRSVLLPLSFGSLQTQKKMKEIQPKLKELERKHRGSKEDLQKAKLELFQQHNVNPLSGCLPQLIQIGLFILLYQVLVSFLQQPSINGVEINQVFFWLNLGKPDPWFVLPVLAGLTQLILSIMVLPGGETPDIIPNQSKNKLEKIANKKEEDTAEMAASMQKQMLFIMPAMTVVIALKFPSGLALYWIATTVFSIIQQYFVSGFGGLTIYLRRLNQVVRRKI